MGGAESFTLIYQRRAAENLEQNSLAPGTTYGGSRICCTLCVCEFHRQRTTRGGIKSFALIWISDFRQRQTHRGMPKVSSFINIGISAFALGIRKIILQIGFKSKRTAVLPTVPFCYSGAFMHSMKSLYASSAAFLSALIFSLTALRRSAAAAFCSSVISTFLGG